MSPARLCLIGDQSLVVRCGESALEAGHTILRVVTGSTEVETWASESQIPVSRAGDDLGTALAGTGELDWLLSVTNLEIIPDAVLALPSRGTINFHDGLLPRYAGLNTPAWALLEGATDYGVTWHLVDDGVDSGPILVEENFEIDPDETAFTLNARCFEAGFASWQRLLPLLELESPPTHTQKNGERRLYRRSDRPAGGGLLDFAQGAVAVARVARALDFGPGYANPLATPKLAVDGRVVTVASATPLEKSSGVEPGTVVAREGPRLVVATSDHDVEFEQESGQHPAPGASVVPDPALVAAVDEAIGASAPHEPFWIEQLAEVVEVELDAGLPRTETSTREQVTSPSSAPPSEVAADVVLFVARWIAVERASLAVTTPELVETAARSGGAVVDRVPLTVEIAADATVGEALEAARVAVAQVLERPAYAVDLVRREPSLSGAPGPEALPVLLVVGNATEGYSAPLVIGLADDTLSWEANTRELGAGGAELVAQRFASFADALHVAAPDERFGSLSVLTVDDLAATREDAERTLRDVDEACIHHLVEVQTDATPEVVALVDGKRSLTYVELDRRANALAHLLDGAGMARGDRVGIHVERSAEMVIAVLATLKAGAAYVPLDPTYPHERLVHMIEDSGCRVVVTGSSVSSQNVVSTDIKVIDLASMVLEPSNRRPGVDVAPNELAYVIYTSGSTGRPKGVMVEHRNVANFFAGMADVVPGPRDRPERWLALTSLSFDISVLELLWPLTRGVTCVLGSGSDVSEASSATRTAPVGFSLFYFSSSADTETTERYRLLLDGARFADEHGFEAVWTPERHFHAFGGLFPNPSVTGAALATITTRVGIRGGSCVLPLHHPARVAEEWAVVDNLSNGRVGVAFASGWQPNDFVLAPERHADAKRLMVELLATVQCLWRGESVAFPGPKGDLVETRTLPRPIQPELPVWMTTAGNVQTFELAGSLGCNLLTHLLGQSVPEVGQKIAAYRAARVAAGHDGPGRVTLMLHTLLGDDEDEVRERARGPLKSYLATAADLIKTFAWSFPIFANTPKESIGDELATLSPEEMDALLEFSFERYFETSGLFGTVERAADMVRGVRDVGVDEVACLVDFGVDEGIVLERLAHLDRLRARFATGATENDERDSVATLVERHSITHLQCTPSRARLLLADPDSAAALASLDVLLVGGEAFPRQLATDLAAQDAGERVVLNMYGPTETTIWSTVERVDGADAAPALGTPIANTTLYVLDRYGEPAAPGVPGELAIGGRGVVRGYHGRPELTHDRFVPDRFAAENGAARLYRTGDLVRRGVDGTVEFLGRLDHQVKLRGYRIELAEIEHALTDVAGVDEAVVVLVGDPGAERLVAYVASSTLVDETDARKRLEQRLPGYMVPGRIVTVGALPRTPNGKLDRSALPSLEALAARPASPTRFGSETEAMIAAIWCGLLGRASVGRDDNFFELGGHSLLVIQAHRRIVAELGAAFPLTDLFRYTTVATLARHLDPDEDAQVTPSSGRTTMQERRRRRRTEGQ